MNSGGERSFEKKVFGLDANFALVACISSYDAK
jgi:hypothetical protein